MLNSNYLKILEFVDLYGGITIDICKNLFYNTKYGYDSSRKALAKLYKSNYLGVSTDFLTDKKIYYKNKPISSHKMLLLDLYSQFIKLGAKVLYFNNEEPFKNIRVDGFIIYQYKGITKMLILEIDINNRTKVDKFQKLYESNLFQDKYNTFPKIIVANRNGKGYRTRKQVEYENSYINFDFEGLENII